VLGALTLFFFDAHAASVTAPRPMLGNALALLSGFCWLRPRSGSDGWRGRTATMPRSKPRSRAAI